MKILVVDDHALIRDAMHGVLRDLAPDAAVVEAADGEQALKLVGDDSDIELVLLDLTLPDHDGLDLLAKLRKTRPALAVVVLSAQNDRSNVVRALELGAQGFIPKNAGREIILGALRLVLAGGIYIPPEILAREQAVPESPSGAASGPGADLGLTGRQRDVLALVMQGKSNKAICRALELAEPTVKNHVTAILRALKVSNRTEAVVAARARGEKA
jgi:DNA-binding NarL/FixJ family response regulator